MASDKFKDNLDEIMEFVKDSIQQAKEFAGDHVPPLIENLITYYSIYHTALTVLLLLIPFFYWIWFLRAVNNERIHEDDVGGFGALGFFLLPVFGFGIHHAVEAVKVIVAPRLYLLEYASDIVSSGGC